jgi:hypothetical protein
MELHIPVGRRISLWSGRLRAVLQVARLYKDHGWFGICRTPISQISTLNSYNKMMDPHDVDSMVGVLATRATGEIDRLSVEALHTKAITFIGLSSKAHVNRYSTDASADGRQTTLQEAMDDLSVAGTELGSFILPLKHQTIFANPLCQSFFERLEKEVQIAYVLYWYLPR